jgi:hypothetical protein
MSHKFRKPKPISKASRVAVGANTAPVVAQFTATALVLTTESKEKCEALAAAYRDEYKPQGQTENDLVEELVTAKWLQRRYNAMINALIDVGMDRMEKEISQEFEKIDNAARTVLAFVNETNRSAALALLHRYVARYNRDYHRALDKLKEIQAERRELPSTGHRPLATDNCFFPNEPKRVPTKEQSTTCEPLQPPRLIILTPPVEPPNGDPPPPPPYDSEIPQG